LTVLFLGNLIPDKGVLILLEAAARVCRTRPDVRFQFAGAWWCDADRQAAEQIIATHQLHERVEFLGVVEGERKWAVLSAADLLAFPTFYNPETFGLVLIEALWAGLPVVTTARAAIPEIIEDGVNGLLVNEQDAGDLAAKIRLLASDPAMRARIGAANPARFAAHYTHEQYGQRMAAALTALLQAETGHDKPALLR
jgi:glycosyltransferase involved in cell wall biosynthesis